MDFTETNQWVSVIKAENLDYNVAEKTVLTFLDPHGFLVGDFLTETTTDAKGMVYEVPDPKILHLARQGTNQFAYSGVVTNGVTTSSYASASIEHGINNQMIQDLVDRTLYLKNKNQELSNYLDEKADELSDDIQELEDKSRAIVTSSSLTADKNRVIFANINGSYDIGISLPNDVQNGDWIKISHGGTSPHNGRVIVYAGGSQIAGHGTSMVIDVLYQIVTLAYNSGSWHVIF